MLGHKVVPQATAAAAAARAMCVYVVWMDAHLEARGN